MELNSLALYVRLTVGIINSKSIKSVLTWVIIIVNFDNTWLRFFHQCTLNNIQGETHRFYLQR